MVWLPQTLKKESWEFGACFCSQHRGWLVPWPPDVAVPRAACDAGCSELLAKPISNFCRIITETQEKPWCTWLLPFRWPRGSQPVHLQMCSLLWSWECGAEFNCFFGIIVRAVTALVVASRFGLWVTDVLWGVLQCFTHYPWAVIHHVRDCDPWSEQLWCLCHANLLNVLWHDFFHFAVRDSPASLLIVSPSYLTAPQQPGGVSIPLSGLVNPWYKLQNYRIIDSFSSENTSKIESNH